MRAILTVFRKEFRENLRDRRTLLTALVVGPLLGPILFALMLQLAVQRGTDTRDEPVTIAVSYADRAPSLVGHLQQYGIVVQRVALDDEDARRAVQERRYRVVLTIPENYRQKFLAGEPAPVLLYADASDAGNDRGVGRVRAAIAQYGLTISRLRLLVRGIDPATLTPIAAQDIDVSTPAARAVVALGALTYLVILTMLMGGLYLAIDATAGERERGSLEALLTVPVRREHLMYGKMLAACAFMLVSLSLTATAFAVSLRYSGLEQLGMTVNFGPRTALAVVACCAPLAPLGAALMTTVAAYTRSYREAQTWIGLVLLVPTLPLVFASVLGLRPTPWLMAVPSLSQHFLVTSLLRAEPIPASFLAISVATTLALGLALAAVAGRLYRREALLG
jgi:sodium transport system permease protein